MKLWRWCPEGGLTCATFRIEVRWRGGLARIIAGKNSRYKFFWIGNAAETGGVDVLLAEKWIEKVSDIK